MVFWKNWPYWSKMALAFFIFFLATLGFALVRAKSSEHRIALETLATTPAEKLTWENRPKVVYFWATWCSVCKTYSYILGSNLELLSKDTVFLSVVEEEDSPSLRKYITEHQIKYPVLLGNSQLLRDWGVNAYPTTVFLNREGRVVFFDTGIINPLSFWLRSFLSRFL